MEIWINEEINPHETYSDEEKFSLFNGSSEKEERKEDDKKGEGIEQDDGIGQGNQGDGLEQTKKGERSEKPSQDENPRASSFERDSL
jgi:hypothetical protein